MFMIVQCKLPSLTSFERYQFIFIFTIIVQNHLVEPNRYVQYALHGHLSFEPLHSQILTFKNFDTLKLLVAKFPGPNRIDHF